jgi:hypothetical protein
MTGGRVWGQKGGTVAQNSGPIVALPPMAPPVASGMASAGASGHSGNTAQALELSTADGVPRRKSLLVPVLVGLGACLFVLGAVAVLGLGVLRAVGLTPPPAASLSGAPLAPSPPNDVATGGSPSRDRGSDLNIAGSAPLIVPSEGAGSPFDSLRNPAGGSGGSGAPRPRDDAPRPKSVSSAPVPHPGSGGRPPSDAAKTAQCYTDPFTGVVRLAVKGRVPAGAALYACKQNPFTGQYQKAK